MPNPAARALVTQRTDAVALVVAESEERVFGEPFFAGVIRGIGAALSEADLQLVLMLAQRRSGAAPRRATSPASTSTACCCSRCTTTTRCRSGSGPRAAGRARRPATESRRSRRTSTSTTCAGPGWRSTTWSHRGRRHIATIAGPGRHGGRAGPATRATAGLAAAGRDARRAAGRARRLQPGRAARPAMRDLLVRGARPGRRLLRQRPDGGRRAAGAARGRPAGARTTSRWSASTTRRSRCRRTRR